MSRKKREKVIDVYLKRCGPGFESCLTVRIPVWRPKYHCAVVTTQMQKKYIQEVQVPDLYPGWELTHLVEKFTPVTQ